MTMIQRSRFFHMVVLLVQIAIFVLVGENASLWAQDRKAKTKKISFIVPLRDSIIPYRTVYWDDEAIVVRLDTSSKARVYSETISSNSYLASSFEDMMIIYQGELEGRFKVNDTIFISIPCNVDYNKSSLSYEVGELTFADVMVSAHIINVTEEVVYIEPCYMENVLEMESCKIHNSYNGVYMVENEHVHRPAYYLGLSYNK